MECERLLTARSNRKILKVARVMQSKHVKGAYHRNLGDGSLP